MLTRLFQLAFWGAAAFAAVMALIPAPPGPQISDKIMHIVAFFTLAVLAAGAYPRASLFLIGMALAAFGAAVEIAQLIPALNRTGDIIDWLADIAAVAVALILIGMWRKRSDHATDDS